jgi:hypothetical protein
MKRREIAPEEWREFFESFNGQHEGWLIDVERFEEFLDETIETRHRGGALRGIQLEQAADRSIALAVDDKHSGHLETESIQAPLRIILEQTEDDVDAGLEIEGPQSCLILRFHSPSPSEKVDEEAYGSM